MIAYDKIKLSNLLLIEQAKYFKRCGTITQDELISIGRSKADAYHRTNIFIRAGVLFLTMILASSSYGLLILFTGFDSFVKGFEIALLFISFITIFILDYFIKTKQNYATGIDDGLLYFALNAFALFVGLTIEPSSNITFILFFGLLALAALMAFIRYTDALAAVVSYFFFLTACFFCIQLSGSVAKLIMPFAIFAISLVCYVLIKSKATNYKFLFWIKGMQWLQYSTLLTLYFSVNYFVVREASVEFFGMVINPGEEIPLYFLFYFFTVAIPLFYVFMGIKNKDNIRLNCGLVLTVASIATIRYYHQIVPLEYALILAGVLLLSIAAFLFKYLKTPKNGFTVEVDIANRNWFSKDIESILIAQSVGNLHTEQATDNLQGGGKFGGGGAGENF